MIVTPLCLPILCTFLTSLSLIAFGGEGSMLDWMISKVSLSFLTFCDSLMSMQEQSCAGYTGY